MKAAVQYQTKIKCLKNNKVFIEIKYTNSPILIY